MSQQFSVMPTGFFVSALKKKIPAYSNFLKSKEEEFSLLSFKLNGTVLDVFCLNQGICIPPVGSGAFYNRCNIL